MKEPLWMLQGYVETNTESEEFAIYRINLKSLYRNQVNWLITKTYPTISTDAQTQCGAVAGFPQLANKAAHLSINIINAAENKSISDLPKR